MPTYVATPTLFYGNSNQWYGKWLTSGVHYLKWKWYTVQSWSMEAEARQAYTKWIFTSLPKRGSSELFEPPCLPQPHVKQNLTMQAGPYIAVWANQVKVITYTCAWPHPLTQHEGRKLCKCMAFMYQHIGSNLGGISLIQRYQLK